MQRQEQTVHVLCNEQIHATEVIKTFKLTKLDVNLFASRARELTTLVQILSIRKSDDRRRRRLAAKTLNSTQF